MAAEVREGWRCSCGETFPFEKHIEFVSHIGKENRKKGMKGTHESAGRIDLDTGEVLVAPRKERRKIKKRKPTVKEPAVGAVKEEVVNEEVPEVDPPEVKPPADPPPVEPPKPPPPKGKGDSKDIKKELARHTTPHLALATQIQFVAKTYTTTLTPIMMQGYAAKKYFGWPEDMAYEDWLDTVIFYYYAEHGIDIGKFNVDESLIEAYNDGHEEESLEEVEDASS